MVNCLPLTFHPTPLLLSEPPWESSDRIPGLCPSGSLAWGHPFWVVWGLPRPILLYPGPLGPFYPWPPLCTSCQCYLDLDPARWISRSTLLKALHFRALTISPLEDLYPTPWGPAPSLTL